MSGASIAASSRRPVTVIPTSCLHPPTKRADVDSVSPPVEGLEFAPGNTTAYLAFRATQDSTSTRTKALVVPVTNIAALVTGGNPGTTKATFGAAIRMSLGGHGIRDIRKNADNQYLIIAGAVDETNSFALQSKTGLATDFQKDVTMPLAYTP